MIDFEPLVDILLECLLLDESNGRHGQEGCDALQEASAGVIQELSLYGLVVLASISWKVIGSLRRLMEVGTKAPRSAVRLRCLSLTRRLERQLSLQCPTRCGEGRQCE